MGSLNLTNNTAKSDAKILLVRDEPGSAEELLPDLNLNAEFIEAEFGTDALRKLMKYDFSLLIFDLQTSYQVCSETIQWIKQEEKICAVPIIIITDDISAVFSSLEPLKLGAVDCVQRPLNSLSFIGKIKQYLQLYSGYAPEEDLLSDSVTSFQGTEILLVEDNQTNRMIAEMMLDDLGCKVTMAEDGEEAVALLEKQVFQLIFMDCHMPKMDGYEAARLLKDRMG